MLPFFSPLYCISIKALIIQQQLREIRQTDSSMENLYAEVVVEGAEEEIQGQRVVWRKTYHEAIKTFEANRTKAREERCWI